MPARDLDHALAIGAIDQHQQLARGGTSVASIASTAKVPLPCSGTATWLPMPPASSTSCLRTRAFSAMKSRSREPQSRSIAALTLCEVVSGPGVRREAGRAACAAPRATGG